MQQKKKRKFNKLIKIGGLITAVMILLVLIGQFYTPYDPSAMNASEKFDAPSFAHIMGTDNFGRDIFSRVIEGAGTTLGIAVLVIILSSIVGITIGALTGYYGGIVDNILMRICDLITAFPSIMLALIIIAILSPSERNIIWCLAILFVPYFARVTRSEIV